MMAKLVRGQSSPYPIKVAFQGEPGAYSEECLRAMLGPDVIAVGCPAFDDVFRTVSSKEADYAVVPIENSLGGSIHANYDLLLRYELYVVGEYEYRVKHQLMALPGTKLDDIKKVMSHQQALAQCDNYLRSLKGVERVPTYDTAGSGKMIADGKMAGCAAIASVLAARTYGLEIIAQNVEDDDVNYTRFLLLARQSVGVYMLPTVPAKTSVVFTLSNSAGALNKALQAFSLRDIDMSKIESRPMSATLLAYLRYKDQKAGRDDGPLPPRFQYCFYLDFLAAELDDRTQLALSHLREMAPFIRVLGTYPRDGLLVGPVKETLEALKGIRPLRGEEVQPVTGKLETVEQKKPLNIGIIGFGNFGQFIGKTFVKYHKVRAMSRTDASAEAKALGCEYFAPYEQDAFFDDLDVVVFSTSILSFKEVLRGIPVEYLTGKLLVDVLSVKVHAKEAMLSSVPESVDILCTHPMFGPESGKDGLQGLAFVYDKVRVANYERASRFLDMFEKERCKMVEMTCELHDEYSANTQFVTHLMGRILGEQGLVKTPIDTKGFQSALGLMETTCGDSFDLFYGLYKFNKHSEETLRRLRESFDHVDRQLAAKEGYLNALADSAGEKKTILPRAVAAEVQSQVQQMWEAALREATAAAILAAQNSQTQQQINGAPAQNSDSPVTNVATTSSSSTKTTGAEKKEGSYSS